MTLTEPAVIVTGRLVRLREKREEDARQDYEWRTDPELATYDATRPMTMSFRSYLRTYREELEHPTRYRRSLVIEDLEYSLASAGGERTRLAVTHEGHLTGAAAPGGSAAGAGGAVTPRDVIAARNDNNAVSIDEEMVLLAETEIRYQALTQTLGRRLATLRNVIRG